MLALLQSRKFPIVNRREKNSEKEKNAPKACAVGKLKAKLMASQMLKFYH